MAQDNETVLVIDESSATRQLLARYLSRENYDVVERGYDADVVDAVGQSSPTLVIVDMQSLGTDGITLVRRLRESTDAGIVVLAAHDDESDHIGVLEAGADDFVAKPLNLRVLSARIHSIARRRIRAWQRLSVYAFAGYSLDIVRRRLLDDSGQRMVLTAGEFNALAALVIYRGTAVSRAYLCEAISARDPSVIGARTVDTLVRRLRCKLESDPDSPALIQTVRGIGYRLAE